MTMIPVAEHIYRGCIIAKSTRPNALRWQSYCDGRFISADTLAGMKALIRDTLSA